MGDTRLFNDTTFLVKKLFEREEAAITRRSQDILRQNIELGGAPDGFKHMGAIYTQLSGPARSMGSYGQLHVSLLSKMQALKADAETLEFDKNRIRQALTLSLRGCRTLQDVRDALPNSLKDFVQGCGNLERTRPEAYTLVDNPRSYTQYMKLREKIEFYTATRLLY